MNDLGIILNWTIILLYNMSVCLLNVQISHKTGSVIVNLPKSTKFVILFSLRSVELQHSSYKMMRQSNNVSMLNICPGLFCTPVTMSCSSCFRRSLQSDIVWLSCSPAQSGLSPNGMHAGPKFNLLEQCQRTLAYFHNCRTAKPTKPTEGQLIFIASQHKSMN